MCPRLTATNAQRPLAEDVAEKLTVARCLRHSDDMRRYLIGILAPVIMVALVSSAHAQRGSIRLDGWIQWISGDRMMLALGPGQSISIELRDVPQDQYMGLRPRDRVMVVGVPSSDGRRVSANSVIFAEPGWADQSP